MAGRPLSRRNIIPVNDILNLDAIRDEAYNMRRNTFAVISCLGPTLSQMVGGLMITSIKLVVAYILTM